MRKIYLSVSAFLFLSALWCFVYPYAAEANVCNVISCHMYMIGGAVLSVSSVLVLVVSFCFKGSENQNVQYTDNRKELLRMRQKRAKFNSVDIAI